MLEDVRDNLCVTESEGFKVKFQMNDNDYCQNKMSMKSYVEL